MNILFVVKRPGMGGVQTFVKVLNKYLTPEHNCTIYFHYPDYNEDLKYFKDYDCITLTRRRPILLAINILSKILKSIINLDLKKYLTARHFIKTLNRKSIDLVHLNTDTCDYFLTSVHQLNIPIVLTLHGIYKDLVTNKHCNIQDEYNRLRKIHEQCSSITYFSSDNLIPFNKALEINVKNDSKFINLLNPFFPINSDRKSKPNKKLKFALFGRGFQLKGWKEALAAFKAVKKEYPNIELHFYGKGSYLESLAFENKGLLDFYYHGETMQTTDEMLAIDIGLVPSYHEEMPFTIIEFLACQVPVIASNVGNIKLMLSTERGEIAGKLIDLSEEGPNINELVDAMTYYARSNSNLVADRALTSEAFDKFNANHVCNQYLILYKMTCAK